jgi:glycosyltransferase involved in cell wall biosynthesis
MARLPVSAIVTTLNEVETIEACIASIAWADEIYLVDSFSTDGTVDLVRKQFPAVRIEQRKYLGAASQKNFAIDRAAHSWIFYIDADERVTLPLEREILQVLETTPRYWAYSVGRRNFMLGREVRFSGLQRDRVTRLFHREHARYPNRRVHADLEVDGETGTLTRKMDHLYIRSLDHMISKMTRYGNWAGAQAFIEGKQTTVLGTFGHTFGRFFRDYVINLGFLDGSRGIISVGMHVYYTFWKYAKLWEFNQLKRMGKPVPLPDLDEAGERWQKPWEARSHSGQ